jgi:ABC-type phosphate transport system permease subunit
MNLTPENITPEISTSVASASHGWLIAAAALLGTILVPLLVGCAMAAYDAFDPMCRLGGEASIACGMRAFVVTMTSILPGLLVGVVAGLRLASRRDRKALRV